MMIDRQNLFTSVYQFLFSILIRLILKLSLLHYGATIKKALYYGLVQAI